MKVELLNVTPNAEEFVVEIARVSSAREDKTADGVKLLQYLIRNKHWSPFQHSYMTIEIITSKAIAIHFLRHLSFTFQEFSQRYQDINVLEDMFQDIELREQATDNRQSSTLIFDPKLSNGAYASEAISNFLDSASWLYNDLIYANVAKESARLVLPMATTTKMYMTGSIRSWIHLLDIRDDEHSQKETQEVARGIKIVFKEQFPIISEALGYE